MLRFCWFVTAVMAGIAAVLFFFYWFKATTTLEQATAAMSTCVLILIPYVFTRSLEGMLRKMRGKSLQ